MRVGENYDERIVALVRNQSWSQSQILLPCKILTKAVTRYVVTFSSKEKNIGKIIISIFMLSIQIESHRAVDVSKLLALVDQLEANSSKLIPLAYLLVNVPLFYLNNGNIRHLWLTRNQKAAPLCLEIFAMKYWFHFTYTRRRTYAHTHTHLHRFINILGNLNAAARTNHAAYAKKGKQDLLVACISI